jgi:hypothetical protein
MAPETTPQNSHKKMIKTSQITKIKIIPSPRRLMNSKTNLNPNKLQPKPKKNFKSTTNT